jgi:hypothetical protein
LPLGGLRVGTFLLPQSCGTPITGLRVSNQLLRLAWKDWGLNYLDLYLIHTPFAFQPGDEQDPRDQDGNVLYDRGVTLLDTWGRWRVSWTVANAGPSDFQTSL